MTSDAADVATTICWVSLVVLFVLVLALWVVPIVTLRRKDPDVFSKFFERKKSDD